MLVCVLALLLPEGGAAQPEAKPATPISARDALTDAMRAYADGDDQLALERVRLVPVDDALAARAAILEGLALSRAGSASDAANAFARADVNASDPRVAFVACFDAAASLHRAARAVNDEPEARIALLQRAQDAYTAALRLDGTDAEAARQLELVRREMRAIQKAQEEERQREEARQQLADAMRQAAERQEQLADRSRDAANEPGEASRNQSAGEISQDQQELQEQTRSAAQQAGQGTSSGSSESSENSSGNERSDQRSKERGEQQMNAADDRSAAGRERSSNEQAGQGEDASDDSAAGKLREAMRKQDAAQEALAQGDMHNAERAQREAAEAMRRAAEQLAQESGKDAKNNQGQQGESGGQQQDGEQGKPDAGDSSREQVIDTLAGRILQREQELREARQRLRSRRGAPARVEKDW
jgi:hypothetical protein